MSAHAVQLPLRYSEPPSMPTAPNVAPLENYVSGTWAVQTLTVAQKGNCAVKLREQSIMFSLNDSSSITLQLLSFIICIVVFILQYTRVYSWWVSLMMAESKLLQHSLQASGWFVLVHDTDTRHAALCTPSFSMILFGFLQEIHIIEGKREGEDKYLQW